MPRCAFAVKLKKKLPKKQKRQLIKEGPYFCMRTRSITCKPKLDPKINPRWVACWVTVVFYKLLLKLKKQWVHIPAGNSTFETAPEKLQTSVKMKFQQGYRNLCLIKSLASVLFYIGLKDESGHINSQCN